MSDLDRLIPSSDSEHDREADHEQHIAVLTPAIINEAIMTFHIP